jgi:hypothetical protein
VNKKNKKGVSPHASKVKAEADLEARLASALSNAFPGIPRDQFTHQMRFKVRLGHHQDEFDGAKAWEKQGKADIVLFHQSRALAVVEIKREDLTLTPADRDQAQSYANQLTPRPPLVILTNGDTTEIYDSSTSQLWSAGDEAGLAVAKLLTNAATVAANEIRWAIEALMGPDAGIWPKAVRRQTDNLIGQLTAAPGETGKPFAKEFLFPRVATLVAEDLLKGKQQFVIIEGSPMAGKTSILRELAVRTAESPELAVLMLRGGAGSGLFQRLANLFSADLEWEVTADNIRQWLRRMSTAGDGPKLVLAIDAVGPNDAIARDLEELADTQFGANLRVVMTTDDGRVFLTAGNGRTPTAIAARATRLEIGPLNAPEFLKAREALRGLGVEFMGGAEFSRDYRTPWVLRSLYDHIARDPRYRKDPGFFFLPGSLGLDLIQRARTVYADQTDLLRGYRLIARDALADTALESPELALANASAFVVRRDALTPRSEAIVPQLISLGWFTTYRHSGGEDVIAPTAPALFVSELARAASEELGQREHADGHAAGLWLAEKLDGFYLGDLIGAQAIHDLSSRTGGFSSAIIWALLSKAPEQRLVDNAVIAMAAPDGSLIHLRIAGEKAHLADRNGVAIGPAIDLGAERSSMYADTTAWMILGRIAGLPSAPIDDMEVRVDAQILQEIGKCPFPLLRATEDGIGHLEHDLGPLGKVLCEYSEPTEPMTESIVKLLASGWKWRDAWVVDSVETGSLPLIHRIAIALRAVQQRWPAECGDWAAEMLAEIVRPAIATLLSEAGVNAVSH